MEAPSDNVIGSSGPGYGGGDGGPGSGGGAPKRGREDEMDLSDPTKRARDGDDAYVLKILAPNNMTGMLIGKQGVVLHRIMDESGARVRVSLVNEVIPRSGERIVTVSGSLDAIGRAQNLISCQLAEPRQGDEPRPPLIERTLKLLVPNGGAGVLIGKAGSVIKELTAVTGAQIKVSQPSEVIAACQERIVTCTGTQEVIDAAQAAISRKLTEAPPSHQPKAIDYACLKEAPPPPNYPPGPPGYPPPPAPGQYPGYPGYAPPPPPSGGQYSYPPPPGSYPYQQPGAPPPPTGGPGGQRQWHQAPPARADTGSSHMPSRTSASTVATMPLHDSLIPGVIGRGGSIIKEIGTRSGAMIKVSQKDTINAAGERSVSMEGTSEAVALAEHLIRERCQQVEAENNARNAGGGKGGGGGGGYGGGGYGGGGYGGGGGGAYGTAERPPAPFYQAASSQPAAPAPSWQNTPSTYQPGAGGSGGYQFN